jgi:hypothetical protein
MTTWTMGFRRSQKKYFSHLKNLKIQPNRRTSSPRLVRHTPVKFVSSTWGGGGGGTRGSAGGPNRVQEICTAGPRGTECRGTAHTYTMKLGTTSLTKWLILPKGVGLQRGPYGAEGPNTREQRHLGHFSATSKPTPLLATGNLCSMGKGHAHAGVTPIRVHT